MVNILQFSFSLSYTGPKILLHTFLLKMFNCSLSLLVSKFLMHMLTFCLLLCSLVLIYLYAILVQGISTIFIDQMLPTYHVFKKVQFYASIKIFNSLPPSLTILGGKKNKGKFKEAWRKYLNVHSFYSVDEFCVFKTIYNTVLYDVSSILHWKNCV